MSDEAVRIGAFENDDLKLLINQHRSAQLHQFIDGVRIEQIHGRVVERHALRSSRLVRNAELRSLRYRFVFLSFAFRLLSTNDGGGIRDR